MTREDLRRAIVVSHPRSGEHWDDVKVLAFAVEIHNRALEEAAYRVAIHAEGLNDPLHQLADMIRAIKIKEQRP